MLDLEWLCFDRNWRETLLPQVTDPFLRSDWRLQVDRTSTWQFELTFGGALRRMALLVQELGIGGSNPSGRATPPNLLRDHRTSHPQLANFSLL